MFSHKFKRNFHLSVTTKQKDQPYPPDNCNSQQTVYRPYNSFPKQKRRDNQYKLCSICIKSILKDAVRPVIQEINVFYKANRAAEKNVKQQQVYKRHIPPVMKKRIIVFENVSQNKQDNAKKYKKKECVEDLRRFFRTVFT